MKTSVLKSFAIVLILLSFSQGSLAGKKLNTNLYEQDGGEDQTKSFSAKVRVIRDIDGVEVFFDGDQAKGAYSLESGSKDYAAMLKKLENSRKAGGPAVSVTVDADKRIKSVSEPSGSNVNFDPNKPWNFGKVPGT